ncbi:MAG TPA: hypothetical protein VN476_14615 [Pyrinomonadaceae bacterium]|nr:hypothetical protein [Pyrinomonadaceae bacterium]
MKSSRRDLLQRILILALLSVCFGMGAQKSVAQVDQWGAWENGITESWSLSSNTFTAQEAAEAIARWKRIGAIETVDWAGDYFSGGETHGTYVRWSRNGFVIADVDKCQALVMGVTYGRVNVTPSLIQFIPEFKKSSKSHVHGQMLTNEPAPLSFVPVKWRDRLFLVPQDRIKDFSDYVAGLGDFNALLGFNPWDLEESYFYTRYAGKNVVPVVTPLLPREYEHFLKRPITATVTAIEGRSLRRNNSYEFTSKILSSAIEHKLASLTFVRVNVGSMHGAREGLFLRVSEPNLGETVRLIAVGRTSSKGVLVRDVEKGRETYYDNDAQRERTYPRAAVGWKLTTALR